MTDFPLSGGCHCGAVRYVMHAPPLSVQHCHCEICRKTGGGLSDRSTARQEAAVDQRCCEFSDQCRTVEQQADRD